MALSNSARVKESGRFGAIRTRLDFVPTAIIPSDYQQEGDSTIGLFP
jgi:hypothetical protein